MSVSDRVSVIMPSFNSGAHIASAIESVLAQTYVNSELLVVDGGSRDETPRIVGEYERRDHRVRLILNPGDKGPAHARAVGINNCTGEYVAFLDADDLWLPDKLSVQTEFMRKGGIGFSYTFYRRISRDEQRVGCLVPMRVRYDYRDLLRHRGIGTLTVMLRRELLAPDVISVWKPAGGEELLWWLLILKKGGEARLAPYDLARYRDTAGSLSKNIAYTVKSVWAMYRNDLMLSARDAAFALGCYAVDSCIRKSRLRLCGAVRELGAAGRRTRRDSNNGTTSNA